MLAVTSVPSGTVGESARDGGCASADVAAAAANSGTIESKAFLKPSMVCPPLLSWKSPAMGQITLRPTFKYTTGRYRWFHLNANRRCLNSLHAFLRAALDLDRRGY